MVPVQRDPLFKGPGCLGAEFANGLLNQLEEEEGPASPRIDTQMQVNIISNYDILNDNTPLQEEDEEVLVIKEEEVLVIKEGEKEESKDGDVLVIKTEEEEKEISILDLEEKECP